MKRLLLLCIIATLLGCHNVTKEELHGTYSVYYDCGGSETLVLMPDGLYKQVIVIDPRYLEPVQAAKGPLTLTTQGRWEYDAESQNLFLFDPYHVHVFAERLNPDYAVPIRGRVNYAEVFRLPPWGPIKLTASYEGEYMIRVDDSTANKGN